LNPRDRTPQDQAWGRSRIDRLTDLLGAASCTGEEQNANDYATIESFCYASQLNLFRRIRAGNPRDPRSPCPKMIPT
jgi:hypothetical protein